MNLPSYEYVSAPIWLVTILHVLTLTLHFVAMNFVVGGLFFLLFGKLQGGAEHPVAKRIVKLLPSIMAATITLGVAPLLFLQLVYPGPMYSASIASGWLWLGVIGAAIAGYYLLYTAAFSTTGRGIRGLLGLALAAFLYISLVYSSVFAMAERPTVFAALHGANPGGWGLNPDMGVWIPRWLHMLLGAGSVGSFLVALLAAKDDAAFKRARLFFTVFMGAAMLSGFAYLGALHEVMKPIMHSAAIWVMTASLVLALGAMHLIWKKKLALTGALLFASLLGMVILRHQVRLIVLGDAYAPSKLLVQSNWGLIGIFLACFVSGLALCAWMAVLFLRPAKTDA